MTRSLLQQPTKLLHITFNNIINVERSYRADTMKERFLVMMLNSLWNSSFVGTNTYRQFSTHHTSDHNSSKAKQTKWQL